MICISSRDTRNSGRGQSGVPPMRSLLPSGNWIPSCNSGQRSSCANTSTPGSHNRYRGKGGGSGRPPLPTNGSGFLLVVILRLRRPFALWIVLMQKIEGSLRKLAGFNIRASEAGRSYGQMQGLGNARVLGLQLGVRDDLFGQVVRG